VDISESLHGRLIAVAAHMGLPHLEGHAEGHRFYGLQVQGQTECKRRQGKREETEVSKGTGARGIRGGEVADYELGKLGMETKHLLKKQRK
jgi:hypothetical protein